MENVQLTGLGRSELTAAASLPYLSSLSLL